LMARNEEVRAAAALANPPPQPVIQQIQDGIRVNTALKPKELTKEFTPVELRAWSRQFKAFISTSHIDRLETVNQQAYLRSCVDPFLIARIEEKINDDTPLFGEYDSCMLYIEMEFRQTYPLFNRRFDFFKYNQESGQMASDWIVQLKFKGDEADLTNMGTEDHYMMRIITGISDVSLKKKLLKERQPTLEKFQDIILNHEQSEKVMETMQPRATAAAVKQGGGKGYEKKKATSRSGRIRQLKQEGKCTLCGGKYSPDHKSSCRALGPGIKCTNCGRPGHFSIVCLDPYGPPGPKEDKKGNDKSQVAHGRSATPHPGATGYEYDPEEFGAQSSAVFATVRGIKVNSPTPRMEVEIRPLDGKKGRPFKFKALPDGGATRSIVSLDVAMKYGYEFDKGKAEPITAANGTGITCEGQMKVSVAYCGRRILADALVSSGLKGDVYLSWYDLQELDVLSKTFPEPLSGSAKVNCIQKVYANYANAVKNDDSKQKCAEISKN